MKARGALGVLVVVAAALGVAPGAAAKPGYFVSPPSFSMEARLPKSDGYAMSVGVFGHRWVEVVASRGGASAFYFVKGRASRHGVDADLGRFGHIHARFTDGRSDREPLSSGCKGARPLEVHGRLEGSIRFRGENGFATVSVMRAKASYVRRFREVCNFGIPDGNNKNAIEVLEASARTSSGRSIHFTAAHPEGVDFTFVSASTIERVGRVFAWKLTTTSNQPSQLEFTPSRGQPESATVDPAFPFHGSASYVAQPDGSAVWSGDLRAPFAGLGSVALTGPRFHADACRIRSHTLSCQPADRQSAGAAIAALFRPPETVPPALSTWLPTAVPSLRGFSW